MPPIVNWVLSIIYDLQFYLLTNEYKLTFESCLDVEVNLGWFSGIFDLDFVAWLICTNEFDIV